MTEISPAASFVASVIIAVILGLTGYGVNNRRKANNVKQKSRDDTLDNLNESIHSLKKDLADVQAERDKAFTESGRKENEAKKELERLQADILKLKADIEELKQLNIEAKTKAENIAKERDTQLKETKDLAVKLAEEREVTSKMSRQIDTLEQEIRDLKAQIALNRTVEQIVAGIAEKLTTAISAAIQVKADENAGDNAA